MENEKEEDLQVSKKLTGGFTYKADITKIIKDYELPLKMIALVHHCGARKYKIFSWYNEPYVSDSSLMDNLNALYRHFGAHSMGKIVDREGLLHIFHMCCRAGMMISTFIKEKNYLDTTLTSDCTDEIPYSEWFTFIPATEIFSLASDGYVPTINEDTVELEEQQARIQRCWFDAYRHLKNGTHEEILTFTFNDLFKAVLNYADNWWRTYGSAQLFTKETLEREGNWITENLLKFIDGPTDRGIQFNLKPCLSHESIVTGESKNKV